MDLGRFLVPGDTYSPWISHCTLCSLLCRGALYHPAGTISPSLTMPCGGNGPSGSLLASAVAAILFNAKYVSHLQAYIPCVSAGSSGPPGYISYFVVHP